MFKPVPMVLVNVQVPEAEVSRVTAILIRLRLIHLINVVETPLGKLGYTGRLESELLERYQRLGEEVDGWARALDIAPEVVEIPPDLDPEKDIFRLEEIAEAVRKRLGSLAEELRDTADRLAALKRRRDNLELLRPAGLSPAALAELRFAHVVAGLLPSENLPRLEEALSHVHHALITVAQADGRSVVLAACLAAEREVLAGALRGAFFEPLELPPAAGGTFEEALAAANAQLEGLEEALGRLRAARDRLRAELGRELVRIRNRIDLTRALLRARVMFGKVDRSYMVSGWIPAHLVDALKEALAREIGERAIVEVLSPEAVAGARQGILNIPILFNNPYLLRPFERLTRAYGTPSYGEVEPTAFLAVSFLLMFGLMFGDVGQGAVLFGLGYVVFRRFLRYTDYGIILMECGAASIFFGLLYGTVFGVEGLLPVLWFAPLKNITYFMKVALIIGVALISLGLVLSFINALRFRRARLPAAGLLAALFYWILAGLGLRYLLTGALEWDWPLALGIGLATLAVTALLIFQRLRLPPEAGPTPGGRGLQLLEGGIEAVDGTIRYLANTISFIRIAAFALAHAGLFLGVFSLADTLGRMQGGGLLYWLVIVLGNVVIILLEGLVVSIQTVRLEYYEFLSKFFRGGGEPFRPLERE